MPKDKSLIVKLNRNNAANSIKQGTSKPFDRFQKAERSSTRLAGKAAEAAAASISANDGMVIDQPKLRKHVFTSLKGGVMSAASKIMKVVRPGRPRNTTEMDIDPPVPDQEIMDAMFDGPLTPVTPSEDENMEDALPTPAFSDALSNASRDAVDEDAVLRQLNFEPVSASLSPQIEGDVEMDNNVADAEPSRASFSPNAPYETWPLKIKIKLPRNVPNPLPALALSPLTEPPSASPSPLNILVTPPGVEINAIADDSNTSHDTDQNPVMQEPPGPNTLGLFLNASDTSGTLADYSLTTSSESNRDALPPAMQLPSDTASHFVEPLSMQKKSIGKTTKTKSGKATNRRTYPPEKPRGPCVTCGDAANVKAWRHQVGSGEDQCGRCFSRAARATKMNARREMQAMSNVLPSGSRMASDQTLGLKTTEEYQSVLSLPSLPAPSTEVEATHNRFIGTSTADYTHISPLGKRKAKAPVRYGGAIDNEDILKHLGEEDPISDDERPVKKLKTNSDRLIVKQPRAKSGVRRMSSSHSKAASSALGSSSNAIDPDAPPVKRRAAPERIMGSDKVGIRVQDTRCTAAPLSKFRDQRCKACIGKTYAKDNCRFLGVRFFEYAEESIGDVEADGHGRKAVKARSRKPSVKAVAGPYFQRVADDEEPQWPTVWNITPTPSHLNRIKNVISQAMLEVVETELEHASQERTVRRSRELKHRHSCDGCAMSMFSGLYLCKHCGTEMCFRCYDELKAVPFKDDKGPYSSRPNLKTMSPTDRQTNLMRCRASRKFITPHFAEDFIPFTEFDRSDLADTLSDMKAFPSKQAAESDLVVLPNDATLETRTSEIAQPTPTNDSRIPTWTPPDDPATLDSLPVRSFHHTQLDEATFRQLWGRGQTLVVTGLMEKAHIEWTPEYFKKNYGTRHCSIVDCDDDNATPMLSKVTEFFDNFGKTADRVLKLKDWPPTNEFSKECPELYEDFQNMVPMPNYTRRDGVLNIASYFPINAVRPDLGPKMYNALESKETPGGHGSTRLHMDMADAVNIMVYAGPKDGKEGCAVWDIFPAEDSTKIRQFLREEYPNFQMIDPIHAQSVYVDSALRKKLFEKFGVKSWRIYQRAGEAVFIPAGCAHQVCNLADAIKVAVDFVSPENIDRCAQLTEEFRAQNLGKIWKDDVLSLQTTLSHAWLCIKKLELLTQADGFMN